jgi:protein-S-isoprenylcysteine O-methyltransferase Ste14
MHSTAAPLSSTKLILTALYLLLWPALLLVLAGNWHWTEGWLFGIWLIGVCASVIVWLYRQDPALLAERYRRPGTGGQSRRDTVIVYLLLVGFIAWIVLMPLDSQRFRWTPPVPLGSKLLGGGFLLLSGFLLFRSFTDNTFLSPLLRIQAEREQRVVSTGVYAVVRHPMYLGGVLMFLGAPLLVGSLTALAAGAAISLLLALRIVDEERLLSTDLPGYAEYRERVRHRLLPGIW